MQLKAINLAGEKEGHPLTRRGPETSPCPPFWSHGRDIYSFPSPPPPPLHHRFPKLLHLLPSAFPSSQRGGGRGRGRSRGKRRPTNRLDRGEEKLNKTQNLFTSLIAHRHHVRLPRLQLPIRAPPRRASAAPQAHDDCRRFCLGDTRRRRLRGC